MTRPAPLNGIIPPRRLQPTPTDQARPLDVDSHNLQFLSKTFGSLQKWLSIFVRGRTPFAVLFAAVTAFKLLVSALVPPSTDLAMIVSPQITSLGSLSDPWSFLEAQMVVLWQLATSAQGVPLEYWTTSPFDMSLAMRMLSVFIRLPALACDIAIAGSIYVMVRTIANSLEKARLACILWFLNPFGILAIEVLAVPDVAATFLLLAASLLLVRRKDARAGLSFGAGVALKLFPILLLPSLVSYVGNLGSRFRVRGYLIAAGLLGLVGYFAWLFPGGVFSPRLLIDYTPVTQPVRVIVEFTPGGRVSAVTFMLVILYFAIFRFARGSNLLVSDTILPVLLVYYAFSAPQPQYFLWTLPFLILDIALVERRHLALLSAMLTLVLVSWFINSLGYLTPSGYSFLMFPLKTPTAPPFSAALNQFLSSNSTTAVLLPAINGALFATVLIYALEIVRGWFRKPSNLASG